ncbi:hypothetical protein LF817_00225 [Halobacillus sp. A1]|uniref:hypothetical protein n=1 Tax=Halobacillus sp. A1 TaxID=2880262 RepID=UPI0020A62AE1|nr:hypothetical protein [Halobacillus sp. A1]MCP3029757.1 hypothetical protein [Halobacillus sp. A1]
MTYKIQLFKLLFRRHDQLFVLRKAERIRRVWLSLLLLVMLTLLTYAAAAWIGLGTDPLSTGVNQLSRNDYEFHKVWFLLGRLLTGLTLMLGTIFLSTFIFWLLFDLPYKKMMVVQMSVWLIMLIERLTWIPFMVYLGLDWYVSPLSLGIIASYTTSLDWVIYFFGSVSLFQFIIIWLQIKSAIFISNSRKWWVVTGVIFWNLLLFAGTAALSYFDTTIVQLLLS